MKPHLWPTPNAYLRMETWRKYYKEDRPYDAIDNAWPNTMLKADTVTNPLLEEGEKL